MALNNRQRAKIHPSSVFNGKPLPNYIIFTEFVITQKSFLRTVTAIEPEWIGEIMPQCGVLDKINLNRNKFSLSHSINNNFDQGATSSGSKLVSKTFSKFTHL
jgi:HrpA-like RNA helicase